MDRLKLKGKIAEKGYKVESFANAIGLNRSTLYRKLNSSRFTIGEAVRIRDTLSLPPEEVMSIFFS